MQQLADALEPRKWEVPYDREVFSAFGKLGLPQTENTHLRYFLLGLDSNQASFTPEMFVSILDREQ
jgi:hypothetical protein